MLPTRLRDVLALTITMLVAVVAGLVWLTQSPQAGFTIVQRPGWEPWPPGCSERATPCASNGPNSPRYIVGTVTPGSDAVIAGVRSGMFVLGADGYALTELVDTTLYSPRSVGFVWRAPQSEARLIALADPGGSTIVQVDLGLLEDRFSYAIVVFVLGLLVLAGMIGGLAGAVPRGLAIPLACASAIPLLADPIGRLGTEVGGLAAMLAPVLASLLLADAIAAGIRRRPWRFVAIGAAVAAAAAAVLIPPARLLALLLVSLVPMAVLAGTQERNRSPLADADSPGPGWLLTAAVLPAVAVAGANATGIQWEWWLLAPTLAAILVGWRLASRRLARARLQQDLVVTVTEAERARLAAELHDVALQELTLLVRRLDASGQAEAAEMARSVAERLRELCGELHLPILDELGAGPALDWLVGQVAGATGEEIRLERSDPVRPPAGVELAVFRVAQEAISNAVKHGGPPVVVRYATTPTGATLAVDDAGPGLDVASRRIEPQPGHYGLATMQQRAEQIGALLSIRAWPHGGTRVSLEWRAP